ncbi:MAG: hypothetical protein R2684_16575 [Pyrinomonadaceae bacterium]
MPYIYENKHWPRFSWSDSDLLAHLADVRLHQRLSKAASGPGQERIPKYEKIPAILPAKNRRIPGLVASIPYILRGQSRNHQMIVTGNLTASHSFRNNTI